jgi:trimeric autotransporter adhesin
MASTYSNLKIQLMTTGENSGTWGNVTNVNLGTALEEAIVGSADVTFSSGNVTLTLTDSNSSQTARNLRLNLTGTTGGARDLIVPAIEKVYLVNNGCADAVTVKNSSGTGIAVPAGKTMWVYNNGTNVVDAVTHLTSLTLASPLPIASGGTGSNATTYCNLQSNVTGVLPNANTTATASNGASTIVARDGVGSFAANTITANLTGNVTGSLITANFSIVQSGSDLLIKNGATTIVTISSSGAISAAGDITSLS